MLKLLEAYKTVNSLANAKRLAAHARRHPFAVAFLTEDDAHILTEALRLADREGAR